MATVSFRGVAKAYGSTRVLERVDLEVGSGEYLVLVGPSGCGKSTLLRCIAGLEEITAGELAIDGRVVNDVAPRDRDVAMVFQSYALYPHLTVRENMGFPLKIRRRPAAEIARAVEEAAAMLELGHLLERLPAQLSGGQRQRVAMGRAIVRRPKVFLFDEPLSNLDTALRHQVRAQLAKLHRQLGATIVHVTHDQVEAMTLATRILVLDRGVVQQVGTPRALYDEPDNTFVATFLGSPAMNLLPAHGQGDAAVVQHTDVQWPVGAEGPVILGFRPQDAELVPGASAEVDLVESLGSEAHVHLRMGPHKVVIVTRDPCPVRVGDRVSVRPSRVLTFDPQSTRRIT